MHWCLVTVSLLVALTSISATADDQAAQAIRTLRAAGPRAEGVAAARSAVDLLLQGGQDSLLPILHGFRDASPLAVNWLRSAFERTADRERKAGRPLPRAQMLEFVRDLSGSPAARRLAYESLLHDDASLEQTLIPEMLLDPSPEFRRDAVTRLLTEAAAATDKAASLQLYRQALQGAVHQDQVKTIATALRGDGQAVDLQRHFGFLTEWRVIGPFDNKEEKGYAVIYPPEELLDLQGEYDGQLGKVRWEPISTTDDFGIIDIASQISNHKGSLMYLTTTFSSTDDRTVEIRLGTPNAWKLWVNGRPVFEREEYHRSSQMDQYRIPAEFRSGANVILLKLCQNEQTQEWAQKYEFQLRISDATGAAVLPTLTSAQRQLPSQGRN